ncbi:MAG: CBS domain-containing protein [Nocardioidaceae bacterium]|nr:CBS domain-containing protein [Nocardioidaceae bacterium]MBA3622763.1 CBS domain-containing protein [Euzebyales bacterium]
MRARNLAEPFPTVSLDADAMAAARAMAAERLPGLIVCGDDGRPYTVLPGSQVLNFIIPKYVQDQPGLARAFDERASDELSTKLAHHTVRDMVPKAAEADELPVVDPDATAIEVAAVMARMHSPIAAVIDGDRVLGAITVSRLLTHFLP